MTVALNANTNESILKQSARAIFFNAKYIGKTKRVS